MWYVLNSEGERIFDVGTPIAYLTSNAVNAHPSAIRSGPFSSAVAAENWLHSHQVGTDPSPVSGQWYVITIMSTPLPESRRWIAAQKPFPANATEVSGPYNTKAEAESAAIKASGIGLSLPNPLNVFHGLNLSNIVLRMGEILLGIVLIGVGLARITGAQNIVSNLVKAKIP